MSPTPRTPRQPAKTIEEIVQETILERLKYEAAPGGRSPSTWLALERKIPNEHFLNYLGAYKRAKDAQQAETRRHQG